MVTDVHLSTVVYTQMTEDYSKATLQAQAVVAALKESKANLVSGANVGFYTGCPITTEDGKETTGDLIWISWQNPNMSVYVFSDGRAKLEARYVRKSRPAVAVREFVFKTGETQRLVQEVAAVLDDTSKPAKDVLMPIPGMVAVMTSASTAVVSKQT